MLTVLNPSQLTDALYKVHFNLNARRRTERAALRKQVLQGVSRPTVQELDRLMWGTRHHEYKFSAVTSHNLQGYLDLLNVFFSFQGTAFHALLVDRTNTSFGLAQWGNDPWLAYCTLAKELLSRRLDRDAFVIADLQGKPNESGDHLEEILCSIPRVAGCLRATSDMAIFLQLVDVLVGCLQFDMRDQLGLYDPTSLRAKAKRDLVRFVKSKLGLALDEPFLRGSSPYRGWRRPYAFSVWLRKP